MRFVAVTIAVPAEGRDMAIRVRIPRDFQDAASTGGEVDVDGSNVGELLQNLARKYPALRKRIFDSTGSVQRSLTVRVNGEDMLDIDGLYTDIHDGDDVVIAALQ